MDIKKTANDYHPLCKTFGTSALALDLSGLKKVCQCFLWIIVLYSVIYKCPQISYCVYIQGRKTEKDRHKQENTYCLLFSTTSITTTLSNNDNQSDLWNHGCRLKETDYTDRKLDNFVFALIESSLCGSSTG